MYLSPQGQVLTQQMARRLRDEETLILLCGHYEGVDERVLEEIVDEEISIGDYVLTGGELPAMVLIDCVSRLVDGVLASETSYAEESHYSGLLEYPQYTRPAAFHGRTVPDELLSTIGATNDPQQLDEWLQRSSAGFAATTLGL